MRLKTKTKKKKNGLTESYHDQWCLDTDYVEMMCSLQKHQIKINPLQSRIEIKEYIVKI